MFQGSCLCGTVKFEILGQPKMVGTCHCNRCRKAGASAIAFVQAGDVVWHHGKENVVQYLPEAPYKYSRCFCKTCGTALGEILSVEASFPIPLNVLDGQTGLKNQFHVFTAEKPDWYDICDDAPKYEGNPS